ncbi:MAG: hypothetical protein DWQ08_07875 [Proteobacteria bacterium]|nr:MAG: hypothetical protein DWQ08_07875 [Pseudomonadota bacterium]
MTRSGVNSVGKDVTIKCNVNIPDRSSHRMRGRRKRLIELIAVQNLYHEFARVMHKMTAQ